jgi:multidrug transporter EmrE-like cation transporter
MRSAISFFMSVNSNMSSSLINLLALSITEIVGDFGLEAFAKTGARASLTQGFAGYAGVMYFLVASLKHGNIMWVNGMWDGMSGIIETAAAYFLLGERLDHWAQYLGIVFIAVGLVCLKSFGGKGNTV